MEIVLGSCSLELWGTGSLGLLNFLYFCFLFLGLFLFLCVVNLLIGLLLCCFVMGLVKLYIY